MLLEVLLIRYSSRSDQLSELACRVLRSANQRFCHLRRLVWVVELQPAQLVLDTLDNDLRDLVQLVLPRVLVYFLLHQLAKLVVLDVPRELALGQIASCRALIIPLQAL